ncbi:hypothetical protein SISNIDRAFT_460044 [Sistotremastrum niveocremeum HHB9708]|uniref:Saccharopine dehydrogenase NADP binding domain-containing protein n=2 Tax=Sistotremastraceae TaxID=3402574 RepID=A0A164NYT9_9AGAM|nr:hypothetical protein SISNIDRAFT_460044 [Sistotremastrum niveocremeum HHB9708]KZT36506.1 hypothetical protein SISSUDRAFT_1049730 [Sistotremastrum suecicum HHB10207 ss-3]
MGKDTDILVLGATGFTGRLITRYLHHHPQRQDFTFSIAGRSKARLADIVDQVGLGKDVDVVVVDVEDSESVEKAVKDVKVVVNTVGPYWRWGSAVVRACALHRTHYVDLAGENHWKKKVIEDYDFLAFKTSSIIIPACGFDSIPSDISAYLSVRTLKKKLGPETRVGKSTSIFRLQGGMSGGTISTILTALEAVPRKVLAAAAADYALSPVQGKPTPFFQFVYTAPVLRPTQYGAYWLMSGANKAVVQRTWGIKQLRGPSEGYGPDFVYDEFLGRKSKLGSFLFGMAFMSGLALVMLSPVRWLLKKLVPAPGEGPSEESMQEGWFKIINVASTSSLPQPVHAKSTVTARGDPGYLVTAVMISESALAILDLTSTAKDKIEGGILTPMSALGDSLIERLEKTGRFDFESEIYTPEEDKKNV